MGYEKTKFIAISNIVRHTEEEIAGLRQTNPGSMKYFEVRDFIHSLKDKLDNLLDRILMSALQDSAKKT